MAVTESAITRLPYWKNLTDAQKQLVREQAHIRHYAKGQLIHGGSMNCLGMTLVLSGEVRTSILSEEGREVTLFHLYPSDPCVFSASCVISQLTFDTQMCAEADSDLLVVGASIFSRLTEENIYVRCFMYELLTQRFSTVMWTLQEILFKGFDRRLAAFLIGELDRTGSPEIRMTHEAIAQRTNSAREVVARMLKRFASDGLVDTRRSYLRIEAPDQLRKLL